MAFTNSKLVSYIKLSPNCNKPRKYAIKKIVIHHMAGNLSVETCGNVFANPKRMASSNYAIGSDGRVALYVEECNRSWCSSNAEVDHQAITIEVANDEIGGNWHVSDKALNKLVELCVDICKRNGIERLNFTGDKNGNLLMHKYFAATACPGLYLGSKFPWIAEQVNKQLSAQTPMAKPLSNTPIRMHIGPASIGDIKTMCNVINGLGIKIETSGSYIITSAASSGDQTVIIAKCKELGLGCKIYEEQKVETSTPTKGLQATSLKSMTNEQIVAKVGPLFTADQKKTGVLASVSMAQFLVESSYGKSELAQNANNCFGMKQNLSGNTWAGSKWDGVSVYNKNTKEHTGTEYIDLVRPFRKYACVEDSIEDHSAYLLGAKKGTELRYAGLKGETDYRTAITIIKNGGYATSPTYIETICSVIEKWNLTKYDVVGTNTNVPTSTPKKVVYRVRKSWDNIASQLGAYSNLENAKAACKAGYFVFDENGKVVYPVTTTLAAFEKGQEVKLVAGAKYINGKNIPSWVIKSKLYVRDFDDKGNIVFSTLKIGAITGSADPKYFVAYAGADAFKPYTVTVTADALNVRKGPGTLYGKVIVVKKGQAYTIVQEKSGWGFLKSGAGWIKLSYTKKN